MRQKGMLASSKLLAVAAGAALLTIGAVAAPSFARQAPAPGAPSGVFDRVLARVSADLGISQQQLQSSLVKAEDSVVDEEVQAGHLTAAQAQALKARIAQTGGQPIVGAMAQGQRQTMLTRGRAVLVRAAASYIGVTPQALGSELRSGKTLAQVAQEHGKSRDGLKNALLDAARNALQARQTQMLSWLQAHLDQIIDHLVPSPAPAVQAPSSQPAQ
jgi:hypothetical protein